MPLEKTITFDHRFFDDVFRKLGWEKVPRLQGNTPGGETVDYIGDGYALELKHLSTNSYLEADSKAENRKRRLLEFQTVQYLAGNLVVDWINNVAGPSPGKQNAFNRQLFEWHFGNSLRNAMTTADGQIASTRTLRPSAHLRGAVFVVNNALPILDTNDLAQLMVMYLSELEGAGDAYTKRRLPNTDVAFGLCAALEEAIGRLATRHLIERGCRRIAHIAGPLLTPGVGRQKGYQDVLAAAGLALPNSYVVHATDDASGYLAARRLLALEPRPDAIFGYNDPTAAGAMKAILEAGIAIPREIKVIGAGNVHYSDLLRVPLSTIDQSSTAIGQEAAGMLIKSIGSKRKLPAKTVLIDPILIPRESI